MDLLTKKTVQFIFGYLDKFVMEMSYSVFHIAMNIKQKIFQKH